MTIESTYYQSNEIRQLFRQVEVQPWDNEAYSLELMVQVGHLSDAILRDGYKLQKYGNSEREILADELADVVLNTLSLAHNSGIQISELLATPELSDWREYGKMLSGQGIPPIVIMLNLSKAAGDVCSDVVIGNRSNSFLAVHLSEVLSFTAQLVSYYDIDLDTAFDKMEQHSRQFITENVSKL